MLLFDIRSSRPLLVKDHNDGNAIRDLEFHSASGMALSMSSKVVKIWDKATVRYGSWPHFLLFLLDSFRQTRNHRVELSPHFLFHLFLRYI